jgi:UPF0755 protein
MLKKFLISLLIIAAVVLAIVGRFFFSNTAFDEKSRFVYVRTGQDARQEILKAFNEHDFVRNPKSFELLADQMHVWRTLKAGRYEIKRGMSLFQIGRMLRNSRQAPVNLVITKVRTKENLAGLVGRKFETDSTRFLSFLNNSDTLKQYALDTNTVMTAVFPNTYTYLWTTTPAGIFKKLFAEYNKIWNEERKQKAEALGLTPTTAYILASIVEEETTYDPEKGTMASVYLNRLAKGIQLGADPTVKFALRDFGLKRIYEKHLAVESPYNTYRNRGLPPGPICTPSLKTLDEVLNAPKTDYLFFVAKKDFSQGHVFTSKYQEHLKYAREYQQALNAQEQIKQKKAREEVGDE